MLNKDDVPISDRKDEIEWVRMALAMSQIGFSYEAADLVKRIMERLNKLKGKYSLKDGAEIKAEWEREWTKYWENKNESHEQVRD